MALIGDVADRELLWIQPSARKRAFELRADDDVVATLSFQRRTLADAESGGQHWTFKREGFWHPRITVRVAGSDDDVAVFSPRWAGGGALVLKEGQTLQLVAANFWQSEWVWNQGKTRLMRFTGQQGLIKAKGAVAIQPEATKLKELPLLVLLGWYLILLFSDDAAAAGSAGVVAAVTT
jgi:hypothetical protein